MTDINKPTLVWEGIDSNVERAKVFGGWLVRNRTDALISMCKDQQPTHGYEWRESICFVPDINHEWGKESKVCKHEHKTRAKTNDLITQISCVDCGEELYTETIPEPPKAPQAPEPPKAPQAPEPRIVGPG